MRLSEEIPYKACASPQAHNQKLNRANLYENKMLGEGKWGRTKYRRIPESEGDWKGRVPNVPFAEKRFETL